MKSIYQIIIKNFALIMIVCAVFSVNGSAFADTAEKGEKFFNPKFAAWFWKNKPTQRDLLGEWLVLKETYKAWRNHYEVNREAALNILERDPAGPVIKRAHDIYLLYRLWHQGYKKFDAHYEWNKVENKESCDAMAALNYFTRDCNDYPDWRSPIERDRDNKILNG